MKRLKNRLIMMTENIKHLEKSKCFFNAQKGVKNMFIWEWVSIAFGWLVFLFLIFIISALISGIIDGIKKGLKKWNTERNL